MSLLGNSFVNSVKTGSKALRSVASNGHTVTQNIAMESAGFAVAEVVSMATALGVVAVADQIAPAVVNSASDTLAKYLVLPHLEPIEHMLDKACKLEECRRDDTLSREERARRISKTLVVFGASWAAAMTSKIYTRRHINQHLGIVEPPQEQGKWWEFWKFFRLSRKESIILAADESVHYGSLVLANTGAAPVTDEVIRATKNTLIKCGMPEDKAQELSAYTMIWEMPNFLGLLSGLAAIYATHKYPGPLGLPRH